MIERMTEKARANLSKEGSILKKIRIYGGIPMAIMAGGVAMLVCMGFLCGLLYNRALLCSTFSGRNKLCAEDTGFGCGILFR